MPKYLREVLFYKDIIKSSIDQTANTILDVAGGDNSLLYSLKKSNSQKYFVNGDGFLPYLKFSKNNRYYDECVLCDINHLPFKEKTFDVTICLHAIEHLEKSAGWGLIRELENIARKQVILATPVGFQELHSYDGNPYQIHRSGWTPAELEKKGFKIKGSCGFRRLRGERARPILGSNPILKAVNYLATLLSQLISYFVPDLAWEMVCFKSLKEPKL